MAAALLLKGIFLGVSLSILVGPILIAIVQTSLEQGRVAGLVVGSGIWVSDVLFIAAVYLGISTIQKITAWEGFELTMGIAGGIILVLFGLAMLLSKPPAMEAWKQGALQYDAYWKLWLKGFLINTINPFTFFFWISITSTIVVEDSLSPSYAMLFYGGLLGTIIATDSIKALFADWIRSRMKPNSILWMRRIAGAALILFGIVLVIRVL